MGQTPDLSHWLQQTQEARVRDHNAGHGKLRVGEHPLQGNHVGRAGGRAVGHERDLVGHERGPSEVGAKGLAIVGVDSGAHQHALPACGPARHQGCLSRGRGPVVVRGGHDVQAGKLGHQRLVFVDGLERALADLRLVRRIGGVELAPQEQLIDDGRSEMTVCPGAQEADQIDPIAFRQPEQSSRQLGFRLGSRQIET